MVRGPGSGRGACAAARPVIEQRLAASSNARMVAFLPKVEALAPSLSAGVDPAFLRIYSVPGSLGDILFLFFGAVHWRGSSCPGWKQPGIGLRQIQKPARIPKYRIRIRYIMEDF